MLSVWEKRGGRIREGQYVFTLGREPTTREVSVLSEKVRES